MIHGRSSDVPLVGITGRRLRLATLFPRETVLLGDDTAEVFVSQFAAHLGAAGGLPFPIAWDTDPDLVAERLDALVLTGGEDLDPARSGAPTAGSVSRERDAVELALLAAALERGLPVLGVCRGLQLLNVAFGGTLTEAAPRHDRRDLAFRTPAHAVTTVPGTLAAELYGSSTTVNSVHQQCINRLAGTLTAAAHAPDQTVEAAGDPTRPVFGVQWHPEFHPAPDPAFCWVVSAARSRAREPRAA